MHEGARRRQDTAGLLATGQACFFFNFTGKLNFDCADFALFLLPVAIVLVTILMISYKPLDPPK
jgi:hypothetical protein